MTDQTDRLAEIAWDEEFVQMFEAWLKLRAQEGVNVADLRRVVAMARAEHELSGSLASERDAAVALMRQGQAAGHEIAAELDVLRADAIFLSEIIGSLTAERDAARSQRDTYQVRLVEKADELAALRAVVEEAQGHLEWAPKSMTYKEFNDSVLVAKAILDRGLKGSGES